MAEASAAQERIRDIAVRTPLVKLDVDAPGEIYLKLENLQPIGSFKIRGAAAKMLAVPREELAGGVWTASAGNMAQGVAWCARHLDVACTVVLPDTAPRAKVAAVERLGARVIAVPREEYFEIFATRTFAGQEGLFIHAFSDPWVMAGNGTLALEVLEDLPDIDTMYVPYGGGGLSCGIASVMKQASARTRVIACEPDTAAPFHASWAQGEPTPISFTPSFVDGAGGARVFPEMFELARELLSGAAEVSLKETADALRLLAQQAHVVGEGAGGLALAAALEEGQPGRSVCVVSGGNINASTMADILSGDVPSS
jgi:threonine dehydratase